MNNITLAGDVAILLPVLKGVLLTCCQQDVMLNRVQVSVDYLYIIPGVSPICLDFYMELPQTSTAQQNGLGRAYNLVTFAGPDDLCTLDTAMTATTILSHTFQFNPGQMHG